MTTKYLAILTVVGGLSCILPCNEALAQAFGVEVHATMMPASGGMGGVSIARPQDLQSALASNPATLRQFGGTQFSFGAGWVEPTINIDNNATLGDSGIVPYSAKSGAPGAALPGVGVTQELTALGLPATLGVGLLGASGLGVEFRGAVGDEGEINASNGTTAMLQVLNTGVGGAVQMTDRLSLGAEMIVSAATLDGPFAGVGAAAAGFGLRGNLGVSYELNNCTTLGFYWLTRQSFQFDDAILLQNAPGDFSAPQDIQMDLPATFGWGITNERLMCGRLLVGADVLYKKYSETDLFGAIWEDQFVLQTGMQYRLSRKLRLRLGYVYTPNHMRDLPSTEVGGILPSDALSGVQYVQAQFPSINEHRLTGGVGVRDILPGVDLDLYAGGMFDTSDQLGDTEISVESYWVGMGVTWRFGRGSCERLPVPNQWCPDCDIGCGLL